MKQFHKNSKHNDEYNFQSLIEKHPPLKNYVQKVRGRVSIDFSNPKAVKMLNTALLRDHYGIKFWQFPEENLCPPIPSRADYLLYINDLPHSQKNITVLDIGTGATLVYPLIGNALFGWQFVASDTSEKSLLVAKEIIEKNRLEDYIKLVHQEDPNKILINITSPEDRFTFTVCNPPFYSSKKEMKDEQERKMRNLKTSQKNFSGLSSELWYKGGEQQFIENYVKESAQMPELSQWFTCLISKKETLHKFKQLMKQFKTKKYEILEMKTGNKVTRVAAWQF